MSVAFVHPDAFESTDRGANDLLKLVQEFRMREPYPKKFSSEVIPVATLADEEILGISDERVTDFWGRTKVRYFRSDGRIFGLADEALSRLTELASKIQSTASARNALSHVYVADQLFSWISGRYLGRCSEPSFARFLTLAAADDVKLRTIWVPIAKLEVEESFTVGLSTICPISSNRIDEWRIHVQATAQPEALEHVDSMIQSVRQRFQGMAASMTTVFAESTRAEELAIERAVVATNYLGAFSIGSLVPNARCASRVLGQEHVDSTTTLSLATNECLIVRQSTIDLIAARPWRLCAEEILEIRNAGLDVISRLLLLEKPSRFQQSILSFVRLYSKAAYTSDSLEKIVFVLSALESLLLKSSNEPIQQNLSERVAVFVEETLDTRKSAIRHIRRAYDMRSRYLHHGNQEDDAPVVKAFLEIAWKFFIYLLANADRFEHAHAMIDAIDDHKLS